MRATTSLNIRRWVPPLMHIVIMSLGLANTVLGQTCLSSPACAYTGDPAADKQTCLSNAPVPFALKPSAEIGGTLWPTLIQTECFANSSYSGFSGLGPLTITSGTDGHDFGPPGTRGHAEGYKVDVRIVTDTATYLDPFSLAVLGHTNPVARGNQPYGYSSDCRSDGAPWYVDPQYLILAMEYPRPPLGSSGYSPLAPKDCTVSFNPTANPPHDCQPGSPNCIQYTTPPSGSSYLDPQHCCHWDLLSSFNTVTTPWDQAGTGNISLEVGQTVAIAPLASTVNSSPIDMEPWMFEYLPQQVYAFSVDPSGNITGLNTNPDGTPAQIPLWVSAGGLCVLLDPVTGAFYCIGADAINVTVSATQPPGGGQICLGSNPSLWSACWHWDPVSASWIWYPDQNGPTSPGNPPPGPICSSSTPPPCWYWNQGLNNGNGGWRLMPPKNPTGGGPSPTIPTGAAADPNDIAGPPGAGAARYISGAAPSPYTIFFENDPAATLAAQKVVITDLLDTSRFDLTTLRLEPITFPGALGVVPPAIPLITLNGFSTQVDLRPDNNLLLNVTASLSTSGLLTWTLQSIDPATGQPPTDPLAGFLPPGSEGSVAFSANLQTSLATNTAVTDQATVVFDANAQIATPVWSNSIDHTAPTSRVSPLASFSVSPAFTVQWSGTDVGSGISDYTVYVSDNGAPFSVFQNAIVATSASFIGQPGHSYGFYSIARDLVGNVEGAKSAAEATTQVAPTFSAFSASLEISKHGFDLSGKPSLAAASNGINPVTDPVTLQLGAFTIAVPPGSFRASKKGGWNFEGTIAGVKCEFQIRPLGAGTFGVSVEADGVNLTGLTNPVTVSLTIGDNTGRTEVFAEH